MSNLTLDYDEVMGPPKTGNWLPLDSIREEDSLKKRRKKDSCKECRDKIADAVDYVKSKSEDYHAFVRLKRLEKLAWDNEKILEDGECRYLSELSGLDIIKEFGFDAVGLENSPLTKEADKIRRLLEGGYSEHEIIGEEYFKCRNKLEEVRDYFKDCGKLTYEVAVRLNTLELLAGDVVRSMSLKSCHEILEKSVTDLAKNVFTISRD